MSAEDNAKVETEIYITEQRFVMMLSFPSAICQLPWNKVTQGQHQNRNPTQEWARNQGLPVLGFQIEKKNFMPLPYLPG